MTDAEGAPPELRPDAEQDVRLRLAELERRLRSTQALVARVREEAAGWPAVLEGLRQDPAYEAAYEEPDPLVSVVIPTFNAAQVLVERPLRSLLRQTHARWEAVVVGDHCTDDTEARVRALGDDRIRFTNLPVRGPYPETPRAMWFVAGVPPANEGLRLARGAWTAHLDHDDEFDDDHLEVLLAAAREQRAEVVYSAWRAIDGTTGETSQAGTWPPRLGGFAWGGALTHGLLTALPFDIHCHLADEPGDWHRARRLLEAGARFAYVDRPTFTYHYVPKPREPTTEERTYDELRAWARSLEEGRDWWEQRAKNFEEAHDWLLQQVESLQQELARRDAGA